MPMQQHKKMKYIYIGIDCHKKTHTATAINCFNEKLVTITFNNDKTGYQNLIKMVSKYKGEQELIFRFGRYQTSRLWFSHLSIRKKLSCKTY